MKQQCDLIWNNNETTMKLQFTYNETSMILQHKHYPGNFCRQIQATLTGKSRQKCYFQAERLLPGKKIQISNCSPGLVLRVQTYIHTYIHTYICMHTYACMHAYILYTYIHTYIIYNGIGGHRALCFGFTRLAVGFMARVRAHPDARTHPDKHI